MKIIIYYLICVIQENKNISGAEYYKLQFF
jgi:hypothetical protein